MFVSVQHLQCSGGRGERERGCRRDGDGDDGDASDGGVGGGRRGEGNILREHLDEPQALTAEHVLIHFIPITSL